MGYGMTNPLLRMSCLLNQRGRSIHPDNVEEILRVGIKPSPFFKKTLLEYRPNVIHWTLNPRQVLTEAKVPQLESSADMRNEECMKDSAGNCTEAKTYSLNGHRAVPGRPK